MASTDRHRPRTARDREPRPQRGPVNLEVALARAVAWSALRVRTAAVFVVPCGPCRASSRWPRTVGPRGRGPTRMRALSPSSCHRTSGTDTRRPRGRSDRRRPRRGTASSAFAGCFCCNGSGGGGGGGDARALWPCECFTACCPRHVMCTLFCLMKCFHWPAPCCCPLPRSPSPCAGVLCVWLTYRGGALP